MKQEFIDAARYNDLDRINRILAPLTEHERQNMIHAAGGDGRPDQPFRVAAVEGHLDIMNRVIELTTDPIQLQNMIHAADGHGPDSAFKSAVVIGRLDIMNRLIELTTDPIHLQKMIHRLHQRRRDYPFTCAAGNGHLDIMNRLIELTTDPTQLQNMIHAADGHGPDSAFKWAAKKKHFRIIARLIEFIPEQNRLNDLLPDARENVESRESFLLLSTAINPLNKETFQQFYTQCQGAERGIDMKGLYESCHTMYYLRCSGRGFNKLNMIFELSKTAREVTPIIEDELGADLRNLILQYVAAEAVDIVSTKIAKLVNEINIMGPLSSPRTDRTSLSEFEIFIGKMERITSIEVILREDPRGLAISNLETVVKLCEDYPSITAHNLRDAIANSTPEKSFGEILQELRSAHQVTKAYNTDLVKNPKLRNFKAYYNERAGVVDAIEELTKQTIMELRSRPEYQVIPYSLIEKNTYDRLVSEKPTKIVDMFLKIHAPAKGVWKFTHGIGREAARELFAQSTDAAFFKKYITTVMHRSLVEYNRTIAATKAPAPSERLVPNGTVYMEAVWKYINGRMEQFRELESGATGYFKANPEFFEAANQLAEKVTQDAIDVFNGTGKGNNQGKEMAAEVVENAVNNFFFQHKLSTTNTRTIRFVGSAKPVQATVDYSVAQVFTILGEDQTVIIPKAAINARECQTDIESFIKKEVSTCSVNKNYDKIVQENPMLLEQLRMCEANLVEMTMKFQVVEPGTKKSMEENVVKAHVDNALKRCGLTPRDGGEAFAWSAKSKAGLGSATKRW